ncbi:hypothetical protein EVAR_74830_1 [Eumeta japonica]|uniref:Uncharacterized protein n=1 Tax=Eumeta variegata TaxID=151549 RepID=A0A4C1SPK4_EUMVA|nr:hypothetical protein EVAR_74830_1 [Eumeta japonica]
MHLPTLFNDFTRRAAHAACGRIQRSHSRGGDAIKLQTKETAAARLKHADVCAASCVLLGADQGRRRPARASRPPHPHFPPAYCRRPMRMTNCIRPLHPHTRITEQRIIRVHRRRHTTINIPPAYVLTHI